MPILGTPDEIRYRLKRREPAGQLSDLGLFTTKRARKLGDFVNLPNGAEREPLSSLMWRAQNRISTPGHIWRVVVVEEPDLLVVEYVRPHDPSTRH